MDPEECAVEVFVRRGRAYALLGKLGRDDQIRSEILSDFNVAVSDICS